MPSMSVAANGTSFEYENFVSSANNDCPSAGAPTSITIDGRQKETGFFFTLCLARPNEIGTQEVDVKLPDPANAPGKELLTLINFLAKDDSDCTYDLDGSEGSSGLTATFAGFCRDGIAEDYSLKLRGTVGVTKTCMGQTPENLQFEVSEQEVVVSGAGPLSL